MKAYFFNLPGTTEKNGPVSADELVSGAKKGIYPPDTLVWCSGMAEWLPLHQAFPSTAFSPSKTSEPLTSCPPSHITAACILTVLNFLLFWPWAIVGIFAIVKACKVEELWRQGKSEEAIQASNRVKYLNKWSLFLLLLPLLAGLLLLISLLIAIRCSL